jgi:signal peptidase II
MRFWGTIITILVLDQLSKFGISGGMILGDSKPLIDGILNLTYVHNQGAAFSILQGKYWFFIAMALVISAVMIYLNLKYYLGKWLQYSMGLIVGGSLGNAVDRFLYGSVRDFFSIGWFPIFNIADMAITIGGALLMLYVLMEDNKSKYDF